jgi:ribosome-interacting GTPase 1
MPANLTPEYKAAEAAYRRARDPKERLECLREMLRTIPKHKGTDHLQADIKHRIKEMTEELTGPKKGGTRGGPATVIRPEGAAQIALIGPPNAGKSALHARLTGSNAPSAPYPFTTQFPQPGMLAYEDIYFQLIDLPPVSLDHPVPWLASTLQPADACLLVVDLSDPGCVDQVMNLHEILAQKRVILTEHWYDQRAQTVEGGVEEDPFAIHLPTLMLANKADQIPALGEEIEVFREFTGLSYPVIAVSATTGEGLDQMGPWLFRKLGIVRVYTKPLGRAPDMDRPFTVRGGSTVHDVAVLVHKEIADSLKYAKLWRAGQPHGQQEGPEHPVEDGDIVELHT